MSAGFTPGPWQAKHDYTLEGATTIIANVDGEIHGDGTMTYTYEFIATCEDEYGNRSERAQANARLIKAAPDLYAACYAAYQQIDGEQYPDLIGPLHAALAAATGTAKTRNGAECEASQSGPKGNAHA